MWEQLAQPDWGEFFESWWLPEPTENRGALLFLATTEKRIIKELAFKKHYQWPAFANPIVTESTVAPLMLNEWKQFPRGQWLRVNFERSGSSNSSFVTVDAAVLKGHYCWTQRGFKESASKDVITDKNWCMPVEAPGPDVQPSAPYS